MRYATVEVDRSSGHLSSTARFVAETPEVLGGSMTYLNVLADGTAVTLSSVQTSMEDARSFFEGGDDGSRTRIASSSDGVIVYRHFEPSGLERTLLSITQNYELVFETPMPFTDSGGIRTMLIGREETIQEALEQPPEEVMITLESYGEYDHVSRNPFGGLTERQREVLFLAIERGYYQSPREVTHAELAEDLDCSQTNVGEHLRRAEHRVFSTLWERRPR